MMFSTKMLSLLALTSLSMVPNVFAHSWVEEMYVIGANGTFIGAPGFARANAKRTAGVDVDLAMVHLLPPNGRAETNITTSDPMCMSSQTIGTQTAGSPQLIAYPGARVALRYQENGHVTLPQNQPGKPANRGTVYIYGTQQPTNNDTFLSIHKVWNAAGTGGNGKGFLLATRNFDDGQCYQINSGNISTARQAEFPHEADQTMGADLWCQADVQIPANVSTSSALTLYWVWDWPTAAGTAGVPDGKEEVYTTCMDIALNGTTSETKIVETVNFKQGQSLNSAAVAEQLTVEFQVTGTATDNTYGVAVATAASGGSSKKTTSSVSTTTTSTAVGAAAVSQNSATSTTTASTADVAAAMSTVTVDHTVTATVDRTITVTGSATEITTTVEKTVTVTGSATEITTTVEKTVSVTASANAVTLTVTEAAASLAIVPTTTTTSSDTSSTTSTGRPIVQPFTTHSITTSSTSSSTTTSTMASIVPRIRGRSAVLRPLVREEVFGKE